MKKELVVLLGVMFSVMAVGCMQQIAPSSEQGFLVRIAPSGKIVNAVNWDGSELRYAADEKRRITDAKLAFFEREGEPTHYLRKADGKWQKTVWGAEVSQAEPSVGMNDLAKGIIVHVAPDGIILRVLNIDGSEVQYSESIDFRNTRIATRNTCCYGICPGGYACCLCKYCPGGVCS